MCAECTQIMELFLDMLSKPNTQGDICKVLGLCTVQPESKAPEMLHVSLEADGFIQAQPSTQTSPEVQITPQCTFCLFIIRKLENMLPKERTEIVKALETICNHLPDHYKDQCNSFLETYGKQILDFLLTSATPHTICALLHLCLMQERSDMPYMPSDCQFCRTLVILTQIRIGQNATELQTSSALWKTCFLHPN
uniref:Surfactant protein Bb n=1 Tax=Astyanax mexicanus TaxID=7994 RepID=W5LPI9_ASTMX